MKTIIVPVDFSDESKEAAFYAAEMAKQSSQSVMLVHIMPRYIQSESGRREEFLSETKRKLNQLRLRTEMRGKDKIHVCTRIYSGSFFHEINKLIKSLDFFAIVVSGKYKNKTGTALRTKIIDTARNCNIPLIIIPQSTTSGIY
ncbi:hypothetical protein A9P82_11360 [Arachidicoccus ginsenosidimutans]|uniref:universal stress protein n=1 Tax=Arachidicoccus sp. BS20 TaxID=1850526 RepID=UPI0007F0761C|nr:universal stress protein [Arachidicoccus sp. BS20]ANI89834.1 hypothetical protein A9P82_11360 [Arachidicoccus sp. BS20]